MVHGEVAGHDPGKALSLSPKEQMKAEVVKLYTCPMHPGVALTKDGICPKCGKELLEKKGKYVLYFPLVIDSNECRVQLSEYRHLPYDTKDKSFHHVRKVSWTGSFLMLCR